MTKSDKTYGMFDSGLNKQLIKRLESVGNFIYKFPTISLIECELNKSDQNILKNLQNYEWIIFTDVFVVDLFISKLEEYGIDPFELDELRVCAFGEAVSDRLRFVQIHSDVIADNIVETDIFKQIKKYLSDLDELVGLKILVVKGKRRDFEIIDLLKKTEANVTKLELYQTDLNENPTKLKALTKGGAIDEFIFSSADDVFELANFYYPQKLSDAIKGSDVSASDEITRQTLKEFGLKPTQTSIQN